MEHRNFDVSIYRKFDIHMYRIQTFDTIPITIITHTPRHRQQYKRWQNAGQGNKKTPPGRETPQRLFTPSRLQGGPHFRTIGYEVCQASRESCAKDQHYDGPTDPTLLHQVWCLVLKLCQKIRLYGNL